MENGAIVLKNQAVWVILCYLVDIYDRNMNSKSFWSKLNIFGIMDPWVLDYTAKIEEFDVKFQAMGYFNDIDIIVPERPSPKV